jgi:hypothetical protein
MPHITLRSNKPLVFGTLFLLIFVMVSGCQLLPGFSATYVPTPTFPPFPQLTALPTATASPTFTPAPPSIIVSRQLVEDGQSLYSLKLNYPYLESAADPRFQLFNQEILKLIEHIRLDFKANVQSISATSDPNFSPSFITSDYIIENGTHGLLSVLINVGFYMSGAAHPNQYTATLNLDIAASKVLALKDLFKADTDYLKFISAYCLQDLKKQSRLEWETGAEPKAENFQNWNFTSTGLLFSFDPYQVTSYAMGPQAVTIPYSAMKDILNPSGPLDSLFK